MEYLEKYHQIIHQEIENFITENSTKGSLYEPISYILSLGGKRLRPALTLLACSLFSNDVKPAINPAIGIEVFHNFSLVHDDIMDNAPLRRGNTTVHEKWNINAAILSGDAMLVQAFQFIAKTNINTGKVIDLFNTTSLQVCEGQQLDMEFETTNKVSIDDYLKMIKYKTAVLLAASLKIGGLTGNADEKSCQALYDYGINIGIAFQLKDDLLDLYGNPEKVGKIQGGDIIAGKKTYLVLKAIQKSNDKDRELILSKLSSNDGNNKQKVTWFTDRLASHKIEEKTKALIDEYYQKATESLKQLNCAEDKKESLSKFSQALIQRDY